jgi:hypothetical protein
MTERLQLPFGSNFGQIQTMNAQHPPGEEAELAAVPIRLRILAMFLRALFFGALVVVIVRLSAPQSETIWTVYDNPGDLIRLALGFAICLWVVVRFFMFPKRAEVYRAWAYLGLVVAPLGWATAIAIWRWI